VILVNESGDPRAAESYSRVLSQMGYDVVSASQGMPRGGAGKTTIAYEPSNAAQARALANRIPGQTVLEPTQSPLPAGAVVTIR
jgi:hypothetical protein